MENNFYTIVVCQLGTVQYRILDPYMGNNSVFVHFSFNFCVLGVYSSAILLKIKWLYIFCDQTLL